VWDIHFDSVSNVVEVHINSLRNKIDRDSVAAHPHRPRRRLRAHGYAAVTFTLRSRLTLFYTALFGVLLTVIAAVSYRVLAYQLDADVSANLSDLTSGLHGYLLFPNDRPTVAFDQMDPAQAAFVQEATRYYQIFDARTGELIVQSDAIRPLGLGSPRRKSVNSANGRSRST
jgi:hypothetical protein